MHGRDVEMDIQQPTSSSGSSRSIPETDHIKKALEILDKEDWANVETFLQPSGPERITIVQLAAYRGDLAVLKFAAHLSLDVYATDKFGRCALHYAAAEGHVNVVTWLLEHAAADGGPNKTESPANNQLWLQDCNGMTALDMAKRAGHLEVVKLLMKVRIEEILNLDLSAKHPRARPDKREKNIAQKLSITAKKQRPAAEMFPGYFSIGDPAPQCVSIKIRDTTLPNDAKGFYLNWRASKIHRAAYGGDLDTLKSAEKLDAKDDFDRSALHYAAEQGHIQVVKYLVDHPRTATERSRERKLSQLLLQDFLGMSPLHCAADHGHIDIVKYLLKVEAKVPGELRNEESSHQLTLEDSCGRTALHLAVQSKHVSVVKFLVYAGAEVDAKDKQGVPPLLMAHCNVTRNDSELMSRYEEIVHFLVSRKASTGSNDPINGWTVLHYAAKFNSQSAARKLCEYAEDLIWNHGAWHKTRDTPVHVAASHNSYEVLRILLDILPSSRINMPNGRGMTPLHAAALACNLESVRILIDKAGNLAKMDNSHRTAIDILSKHRDNVDVVALFIDILSSNIHLCGRNDSNPILKASNLVTLDFKVLGPQDEPQMAVILAIIKALPRQDQVPILQHPLANTYITLKWFRLHHFYARILLFRLLFAVFLSCYAIYLQEDSVTLNLKPIVFFFAVILFCYNLLQIFNDPKSYFKKFGNWLYPLCVVTTIVVAIHGFIYDKMAWWIPYSVSIVVPLIWIQTMLLAGRLSGWLSGWMVNTLIFPTALVNFLKVFLAGFLSIIVGFAFSFSILLHSHDEFSNPWKAFVKSVLMMTGEYEYGDLFGNVTKSILHNLAATENEETYGPIISRCIFLLFVILTSVVLMNLMIGLAVSDIQGLVKEGDFSRLLKQAEFIAECEQMATTCIFRNGLVPKRLRNMLKSRIPEVSKGIMFPLVKVPRNFCKSLKEDICNIGLKNEKREEESTCRNNEDSSVAMKSSLRKKFVESIERNIDQPRKAQDPKTKWRRLSV